MQHPAHSPTLAWRTSWTFITNTRCLLQQCKRSSSLRVTFTGLSACDLHEPAAALLNSIVQMAALQQVTFSSANAQCINCRPIDVQDLLMELEAVLEHAKVPHYLKCLYQEVLANHSGRHGWFSGDLTDNLKVICNCSRACNENVPQHIALQAALAGMLQGCTMHESELHTGPPSVILKLPVWIAKLLRIISQMNADWPRICTDMPFSSQSR